MSHLHLITTGGTIAMSAPRADAGAALTHGPAELIGQVPGLGALADWTVEPLLAKPSASFDLADLSRIAAAVARSEADGVVITHGTDTLEETAFYLQLVLGADTGPVVLTGAMRTADAPGADGPANLVAAARTALSPAARGKGVMVVMDEEIHAAALVRKIHASRIHAFSSAPLGPLGWISEGRPRFLLAPVFAMPRIAPGPRAPRVPLVEAGPHFTAETVTRLAADAEGLVLALPGGGHVAATAMDAIAAAARERPVVIASRTGGGEVLSGTYGYAGSERDLLARGVISSRWLDPRKARIMLLLLLSGGAGLDEARRAFEAL